MYRHIGCICLTFFDCVFLNVSLNWLTERKQSHTGCICLTFLHCVFWNVSSNCLPRMMYSHIGCICLIFRFCGSSYVFSSCLPEKIQTDIGCICYVSFSQDKVHRQGPHLNHWWDSYPWPQRRKCSVPCNVYFKLRQILMSNGKQMKMKLISENNQHHHYQIQTTYVKTDNN